MATTRESYIRIWWSLCTLERTLSVMTGRPNTIEGLWCSVPWPMPVPEEQMLCEVRAIRRLHTSNLVDASPITAADTIIEACLASVGLEVARANSGSYFKASAQLSGITQNIITTLYSASTVIRSLGCVQQDVTHLSTRLDEWVVALPAEFNFQEQPPSRGSSFIRERMILGFQLCSAKMLLTRPSLGRQNEPRREEDGTGFTNCMATRCIEAAKMVVDFLPDVPDPFFIYDQGPWWCIVHHMMQAMSVFLLGLSSTLSMSLESLVLTAYVKKLMLWLRKMPGVVAERAYSVALKASNGVFRRLSVATFETERDKSITPV